MVFAKSLPLWILCSHVASVSSQPGYLRFLYFLFWGLCWSWMSSVWLSIDGRISNSYGWLRVCTYIEISLFIIFINSYASLHPFSLFLCTSECQPALTYKWSGDSGLLLSDYTSHQIHSSMQGKLHMILYMHSHVFHGWYDCIFVVLVMLYKHATNKQECLYITHNQQTRMPLYSPKTGNWHSPKQTWFSLVL